VLEDRKRLPEAREAFEKAIDLDPSNASLALQYAYFLLSEAFPPGVSRLAIADATPPGLLRAREMFQRATRAGPGIAEAWAGLGATYAYDSGDLAPGIAALEKARRLLPARTDIALNLASLYARGGRRDTAQELVDTVLSRSDDPAVRAAGREVLFRADLDEASARAARGEVEAGLLILKGLQASAPTPALEAEVRDRLRSLQNHAGRQREADLFNQAAEKARRQEVDEAVRLLESLLATATDKEVIERARGLLTQLREVRAYNQAVDLYRRRDFKAAASLLHGILDKSKDERLVGAAKDLLAKVREAAPGVR
jgi:tetratricopeptide (TPR) repeat protein